MTSPKFRLGNRRPYGYLRSRTLLRLRGYVRGAHPTPTAASAASAADRRSHFGLEAGTAGHSDLRQGGVQLGMAIVVKIEYCFDLPVHRSSRCVWSGISSRFHVFFKRPTKKRRGYAGEWSSPRPCLRRERATARARARVMARRVATRRGTPS